MSRPRTSPSARPTRARAAKSPKAKPAARARLSPDARRRQILDAAAQLLADERTAALEMKELAEVVGVTRPVVYKFFPTRQALLEGVIGDFELELSARFRDALLRSLGRTLPEIVVAFVDAACDAIEAKGRGPWNLFDARTADLEAGRIGRDIHERLLAPWIERISEMTGRSSEDVKSVARIVVAAGRAALDGWLEGRMTRDAARRDATRAVSALLAAFADRDASS